MKILKFGAIWCPGCLVMKPIWKEIETENPNLQTEYYDIDKDKEIVKQYNLTDYPTFIFLDKENNEIHREEGELSKRELLKLIDQYKDQ